MRICCAYSPAGQPPCYALATLGFYRRETDPRTPMPACSEHLGKMLTTGQEWTVVTLAYHDEVMQRATEASVPGGVL